MAQNAGLQPIVLCSPSVRLALKRLTERAAPQLVVFSYSEIAPGLKVESIGQISATEEAGRSTKLDVQVDFRRPWGCGFSQQVAPAPLFRRRGCRRPSGALGDSRIGRRKRRGHARRTRPRGRDRDPDLQRPGRALPHGDQDRGGQCHQHPIRSATPLEPDRGGERRRRSARACASTRSLPANGASHREALGRGSSARPRSGTSAAAGVR